MSPNKVLWSVVCGTISGIITAWLVFKFLGGKGCGPKGAREEIGEVKDEPNDLNNPADKLPQENDERLDTRRCVIKVGVQTIILVEMLPLSSDKRHQSLYN